MNLGNFSVSFPVKDLKASMSFYNTLGFIQVSGDVDKIGVYCKMEKQE